MAHDLRTSDTPYQQNRTIQVVSVGLADVRREPHPTSELVTQALLNVPVAAGETKDEWTHVILSDYEGWIRTNQLAEPIIPGSATTGGRGSTTPPLVAIVSVTHTPLYPEATGEVACNDVYLSTILPALDLTNNERIQVALPGERVAWIARSALCLRHQEPLYTQLPIRTITNYARSFLNVPYLWGGTSWQGIDCSGLVQLCYKMGGYRLPRDADQQHNFLHLSVQRDEMQEGDLIFFGSKKITHVGMALNNKEYIHSEGQNYNHVVINSFCPEDQHYYPRLGEIVWAIKRVVSQGT